MKLFTEVTLTCANGPKVVPAEGTACEYLAVTPALDPYDGFAGHWLLVHTPTGRNLPVPTMCNTPDDLRYLAAKVAHLEWAGDDHAEIGARLKGDYMDLLRELENDASAPSPFETAGSDAGTIPRQAGPLLAYVLDTWHEVDQANGQTPVLNSEGGANLTWHYQLLREVDLYSLAFVLGTLLTHLPEVANSVAASVAKALNAGDELGEWIRRWRQELEAGKTLSLPGVPMPEPDELLQVIRPEPSAQLPAPRPAPRLITPVQAAVDDNVHSI